MINSGYIKLHRSFRSWYGISNPSRVSLWINMLLLANHAPKRWLFKGRPYNVNSGQIITSRKSLSSLTGVSESMVERLLKEFESEGQIEQQTTNVNRLITILNYKQYQAGEQQIGQQIGQQKDNEKDNEKDTNKNVKNVKNDKNIYSDDFLSVWARYPSQDLRK